MITDTKTRHIAACPEGQRLGGCIERIVTQIGEFMNTELIASVILWVLAAPIILIVSAMILVAAWPFILCVGLGILSGNPNMVVFGTLIGMLLTLIWFGFITTQGK